MGISVYQASDPADSAITQVPRRSLWAAEGDVNSCQVAAESSGYEAHPRAERIRSAPPPPEPTGRGAD